MAWPVVVCENTTGEEDEDGSISDVDDVPVSAKRRPLRSSRADRVSPIGTVAFSGMAAEFGRGLESSDLFPTRKTPRNLLNMTKKTIWKKQMKNFYRKEFLTNRNCFSFGENPNLVKLALSFPKEMKPRRGMPKWPRKI